MQEHLQISDWIAQQLTGEISKETQERLMLWVNENEKNKAFYEETKRLWDVSDNYDDSFETDMRVAWDQFESKLGKIDITEKTIELKKPTNEAKTISLFSMRNVLRIAAVFLLAGFGFWMIQSGGTSNQVAYQTTLGETKELVLPDQSKIVLNENSQLAYVEKDGKRQVELNGEAWFDVAHDANTPFQIQSGETQTVVLGTAFNVRAYPEEAKVEVTVERGKVAFSEKANATNKTLLPAGSEGVFYKKEKKVERVEKETNEINNVSAWRTKTLVFDDLPMDAIIETLERYYKVNIETKTPDLLNCTFNGTYTDKSIDLILEVFSAGLTNSTWEIKDGTYWLSGTCNNEVE